jgi:hypothetical protein
VRSSPLPVVTQSVSFWVRPMSREYSVKVLPQSVCWLATMLWVVGFLTHALIYVRRALSLPPTEEIYAGTTSFQLTAFMYVWGFYWIGALLILLLIEFAIFGRRSKQ